MRNFQFCAAHHFGKLEGNRPFTSQPIQTVEVGIGTSHFLTSLGILESKQAMEFFKQQDTNSPKILIDSIDSLTQETDYIVVMGAQVV